MIISGIGMIIMREKCNIDGLCNTPYPVLKYPSCNGLPGEAEAMGNSLLWLE